MTLNQLEYFCTSVQCNSITQAARKLFVSQPAISGAIHELEKEFEIQLFAHTRNKLVLTDEGQLFYEAAIRLLHEAENAHQQMKDLCRGMRCVKMGVPPMWGSIILSDLMLRMSEEHPEMRLTFFEYGSARATSLVEEKELDVAIVSAGMHDPEKSQTLSIGTDRFVVVVDPEHPLAGRESISLEEAMNEPLIMFNKDSVQNHIFNRRFREFDREPDILLYTSQIDTLKSMVHTGRCVAFFYESLLKNHPDLVSIPLDPPIEQHVNLVWRRSRYTPKSVQDIVEYLKTNPLFR